MYYLDSQRTVTRRDSSLVLPKPEDDTISLLTIGTAREPYPQNDMSTFFPIRPRGAIRKELVTAFFESMLNNIVESWQVLSTHPRQDGYQTPDEKSTNEPSKKRKSTASNKPTTLRAKKSRSKLEITSIEASTPVDALQRVWWSGPDERVVIRFTNGNTYEGGISMKCMEGEGRFQWADGTIFVGHFQDNSICGKGTIYWKDDTWYEGDFIGNIRHGHGIFVDSREQRSYSGGWHNGTKHGRGAMFYAEASYQNSYEGNWEQNVRHGYGLREYCKMSGYQGTFDHSIREGQGLMIWPNHDVYRGGWENGKMSGKGLYIWDIHYNYTLSMPCQSTYMGEWLRGERHGNGVLNVGVGSGALYKGQFKQNKKHGEGKFLTSNGLILRHKKLFVDDNFGTLAKEDNDESIDQINCDESIKSEPPREHDPHVFNICDDRVGLAYHVYKAFNYVDRQEEIHSEIISQYFASNVIVAPIQKSRGTHKRESIKSTKAAEPHFDVGEFFSSEETFLFQAIRCYESVLKDIYLKYATICNTQEIYFRPVLSRLYLWQLFYDCDILKKGLYFVEIDKLISDNPDWQLRTMHYPFQKFLFWQFLHSLAGVAIKMYCRMEFPGARPDNICGLAFRRFMDCDVIPGIEVHKGHLVNGCATYVNLRGLYRLYRSLGEPHTVRKFIMAVRKPTNDMDELQPRMRMTPYEDVAKGYNAYVLADDLRYIVEDEIFSAEFKEEQVQPEPKNFSNLKRKLFNFANIPTKTLISFFANIFPEMITDGKLMDLDFEITFFEFFEVFMYCVEESNRRAEYSECMAESESIFEN